MQIVKSYVRLSVYKPLRLHFHDVLKNPQDKMADELAEQVGLQVIIGAPKHDGQKYSAQVKMNLPIESTEIPFPNEENPCAMVFQSRLCAVHRVAARHC